MSETISVVRLGISPIKSCEFIQGDQESDAVTVTPRGFKGDRQYCIIGPSKKAGEGNVVFTQREHSKMALIYQEIHDSRDGLVVGAPGMRDIFISTGFSQDDTRLRTATMQRGEVTVVGQALTEGASEWFAEYLDVEGTEIIEFREDIPRPMSSDYIRQGASNQLRYADGSPISLGTEASRRLVNESLTDASQSEIPGERWRANIETDGSSLDDELFWQEVSVGGLRAYVVSVSKRCEIPDVDERTGEVGKHVRGALSRVRKGVRVDGQTGTFTDLNLNPILPTDPREPLVLRVGDELKVLARSQKPNVVYEKRTGQNWGEL